MLRKITLVCTLVLTSQLAMAVIAAAVPYVER